MVSRWLGLGGAARLLLLLLLRKMPHPRPPPPPPPLLGAPPSPPLLLAGWSTRWKEAELVMTSLTKGRTCTTRFRVWGLGSRVSW